MPITGSDHAQIANRGSAGSPGNEASPKEAQTAENTCRRCRGTGRQGNEPCPECGGSAKVVETVGDA